MILTGAATTMHNLNAERSAVCAGCEKPIQDRFLLNVLGRVWHTRCVQCSDCGNPLTEKCFSRDGKLFCREDFFRRFGTKCGGCSQGISPNDLVRRARDKVFHLKCFTCMVCRKQLSTGEELYVLDENKFICKDDYLNSKYSQGSDGEDNEEDLDQQILDKLDDNLSDKGSSYHDDDDSIDGSFPSLGLTNSQQQTTPPMLGGGCGVSLDLLHSHKVKNNSDLNKNNAHNNNQMVMIKEEKMDLDSNDNPKGGDLALDNKENKSETSSKTDGNGSDDEKTGKGGAKRRGPRTTIKAKQLETLKAAFAATPKPTRHIREQLAQETGLNMRVIQVWFQNRRSKERRMKQLSALGARRAFFRNPRRMRGMPDDGSDMMGQPGFNYFPDGDFYPGPGFPGAYPGAEFPFPGEGNMNFMPPTPGHPMMDPGLQGPMGHDGGFGLPPNEMLPPTSNTPDGSLPPMQAIDAFTNLPPPRSNGNFTHQSGGLDHNRPGDMAGDSWL